MQNCTRTINEIVYSATALGDDDDIEHLLKVLEHNRLCDLHDRQPPRHVKLWKSRIMEIRSKCHAQCAKLADDTPPSASQKRVVLKARTSRLSPLRLNLDPAKYWPVAYDVSPFSIIERGDRLNDYKLSYDQIAMQARSPLDAELGDLKDGYVYMYKVEGNDGFVKSVIPVGLPMSG